MTNTPLTFDKITQRRFILAHGDEAQGSGAAPPEIFGGLPGGGG